MMAARTMKDKEGKTWEFNDAEGTWLCGKHTIGCGARNVSKWSIWDGPNRRPTEFKTLREAIDTCNALTKLFEEISKR